MNDTDFLMTDEFIAYSEKIKALYENKKKGEAQFKELFDSFKKGQKKLEDDVKIAHEEWEKWKSNQIQKSDKEQQKGK